MSEQQPAGAPRALRMLALAAVCAGVAALAAAAFIFSYTGIHAVALQAGVNTRLARGYPLILDVLLVVILAAVLALRGAGWPSKLLAWISLLAVLAAAAGADALHAAGDRLPVRTAEITVAILPWGLVLIAFVLLLAMLRQARSRRHGQAGEQPRQPKWQPVEPPPLSRQPLGPGFPAGDEPARAPHDTLRLVVPRQVTPQAAADSQANSATKPPAAAERDLPVDAGDLAALDGDPAPDDPSSDEAALEPAGGTVPYPTDGHGAATDAAEPDAAAGPHSGGPDTVELDHTVLDDPVLDQTGLDHRPDAAERGTGDAGTGHDGTGDDTDSGDAEMPVFHRMWSSPVPPSAGGE